MEQNSAENHSQVLIRAVKAGVYAFLAIILTVGTFFIENSLAQKGDLVQAPGVKEVIYSEEVAVGNNGLMRFATGDGEVTPDVKMWQGGDEFFADVNSAHFWVDFAFNGDKSNFYVGNLVVVPQFASFDLEFDGASLDLRVVSGDVFVGMLPLGVEPSEYLGRYSDVFENGFMVGQGMQVSFDISDLNSSQNYSSILNNAKYVVISSSILEDDWVSDNLSKDKVYVDDLKQKYIANVLGEGALRKNSFIENSFFWLENKFTFFPNKRLENGMGRAFDYLRNAIYYVVSSGDYESDLQKFLDFKDSFEEFDEDFSLHYYDVFSQLLIFGPSEPLYVVEKRLLDSDFEKNPLSVLDIYWRDVYQGVAIDTISAEVAFGRYFDLFKANIGKITNLNVYRKFTFQHAILVDNLFLNNDVFLKKDYFEKYFNVYEKELLKLYPEGDEKDELRSFLVENKIKKVKRLRRYFFDEGLDVQEVKEMLSLLVKQIDELLGAKNASASTLFEEDFSDIDDFWCYLKSPEFYQSATYGLTQEQRYNSYLAERDTLCGFSDIQDDVFGSTESNDLDLETLRNDLNESFAVLKNLSQLDVGQIDSESQRYVDVSGVVGGFPFEAKYDRDLGNLSDVTSYQQLIADRSVRIEDLYDLIEEKFDSGAIDAEDPDLTEEGLAQRSAREYVTNLVAENGFVVEIDDVSVVDELNAVYRIEKIYLDGYEDVVLTFDLLMNGEQVVNLLITLDKEPLLFEGKFTLEELKNLVIGENYSEVNSGADLGAKVLR